MPLKVFDKLLISSFDAVAGRCASKVSRETSCICLLASLMVLIELILR